MWLEDKSNYNRMKNRVNLASLKDKQEGGIEFTLEFIKLPETDNFAPFH